MAQPAPDPDSDPDRPFPWERDHDLERPGVSIRPLSHAELGQLLAQLRAAAPDQPAQAVLQHRPPMPAPTGMPAGPVPASVGRPGGSAAASWRRPRAVEFAGWARTP